MGAGTQVLHPQRSSTSTSTVHAGNVVVTVENGDLTGSPGAQVLVGGTHSWRWQIPTGRTVLVTVVRDVHT